MVRPRTINEKKARVWSREPYFQSLDKTKDVQPYETQKGLALDHKGDHKRERLEVHKTLCKVMIC